MSASASVHAERRGRSEALHEHIRTIVGLPGSEGAVASPIASWIRPTGTSPCVCSSPSPQTMIHHEHHHLGFLRLRALPHAIRAVAAPRALAPARAVSQQESLWGGARRARRCARASSSRARSAPTCSRGGGSSPAPRSPSTLTRSQSWTRRAPRPTGSSGAPWRGARGPRTGARFGRTSRGRG